MVRSFLGHLDLQVRHQPDRSLTAEQVTTYKWLLTQARLRAPHQRVQSLRPIGGEEVLTVADLLGRVRALAEALGP